MRVLSHAGLPNADEDVYGCETNKITERGREHHVGLSSSVAACVYSGWDDIASRFCSGGGGRDFTLFLETAPNFLEERRERRARLLLKF